jgi:hypothetical protein
MTRIEPRCLRENCSGYHNTKLIMFYGSLFVLLWFFVWPLFCILFCYLKPLITTLVYSSSSHLNMWYSPSKKIKKRFNIKNNMLYYYVRKRHQYDLPMKHTFILYVFISSAMQKCIHIFPTIFHFLRIPVNYAHPSGAPLRLSGIHVVRSLVFCIMFYGSLFVLLWFFVWPLFCMSFCVFSLPFFIFWDFR